MNVKTIAISILMGCTTTSYTQKDHFKNGEVAFNNEQFYTAIDSYKKEEVKSKNPELKAEINFKIAVCYANMLDLDQAEVYLSRAKGLKYDRTNPSLIYYMAEVMMQNQEYHKAKELFIKYGEMRP